MNGTDLFCSAVTQMIDPARLAAFASAVVSDGPIVAAPIITEARHDHVLTPRYELVPTSGGVTGRTETGGRDPRTGPGAERRSDRRRQ